MKRSIKNLIMILLIIVVCVCSYFTMQSISKTSSSNNIGMEQGQPPEMPAGDSNNNMGEPPTKPGQENISNQISTANYIMFGAEGLIISILVIYLIMSRFNKLTLKETLKNADKAIIFILTTILVTAIQICIAKNSLTSNSGEMSNNMQIMPGGDSSNTENSEFYGVNAGILVTENSTATIKNATISTNAKGSNAVFSTGTDSKIYISDSKITTTGSGSARGLDATYGGYIEADNVTITTQGGSCATLATDRGEGTVIARNSTLETNGSGSPVIYSTGDINGYKLYVNGVAI